MSKQSLSLPKHSKQPKKSKPLTQPKQNFFQLVPNKPLEKIVPVVLGDANLLDSFQKKLTENTGSSLSPVASVLTTPSKQHIKPDENGVCGQTPGGSDLVHSASHHVSVTITSPGGTHQKDVQLYCLRRKQDYKPKTPSAVLTELSNHLVLKKKPLSVIASNKTKKNQPPRKTQKKEKDVVGQSAKHIVIDFFKRQGVSIAEEEIAREDWNLCHLLSYAIAMNGETGKSMPFNTQIQENLCAGPRALNENMMRIENVLLQFIKDNAVKEIHYMAIHSEIASSHILSDLTLNVGMVTHHGVLIGFKSHFDITENRRFSHENSTALHAFLQACFEGKTSVKSRVTPTCSGFFKLTTEESNRKRKRDSDDDDYVLRRIR